MTIKSSIIRNFDSENFKQKLPEYENDFYKKMLKNVEEEMIRSEMTGFKCIFPKKENVEKFGKVLSRIGNINDSNIVLWEYLLRENIYL